MWLHRVRRAHPGLVAVVEWFEVPASARRTGVSALLLRAALRWLEGHGVRAVYAYPDPKNVEETGEARIVLYEIDAKTRQLGEDV